MFLRHEPAVFETELGWMAAASREGAVVGLVFGHANANAAVRSLKRYTQLDELMAPAGNGRSSGDWTDRDAELLTALEERLTQFAAGEEVDFRDIALAQSHLTGFARRVTNLCRKIPWGKTRTYGELAAKAGSPGAARAVGRVMAENRFPLVVPCHRVVAAGGGLGGYSAPQGLRMKRRLLESEAAGLVCVAH